MATVRKNCESCRFWSQMCAMTNNEGHITVLCLSSDGPKTNRFTEEHFVCLKWKENTIGSVDEPPDYGGRTRELYGKMENQNGA